MKSQRMRRFGVGAVLAVAAAAVAGAVTPVGTLPASAAAVNIRLININDFHGRIDTNTVKFAGTVEQQRAAAPTPGNVLFLAAGDLVGASLFASATQNDDPAIDVLNALALNSSSVGNHEFDKGLSDLTTHLEPRSAWTYLCANCYNAGTTTPALPEYTVFTVGGVTVGVIGAVTQDTPSLVSPAGVATLSFGDPVAAVNRVAQQLSDGNAANGEASILVAEYHEGADVDDTPTLAEALATPPFANIANNTSGLVDAIFTGHTHEAYSFSAPVPGQPGRVRPIVQTGQYGERVGVVDLVVDDVTGTVTTFTSSLVNRTAVADSTLIATFPRVAQVNTIVNAALAYADAVGSVQVGTVTGDITTAFSGGSYVSGRYTGGTRDDRASESTLGNLVADALLESLQDPLRGVADVTVVNPGGLRAELLLGTDGGVVTYAEANGVLPFANTLITIDLTGAQLKTMLEQQWQRDPAGAVPARPYLQLGLSENFTYTYDPSRPEGSRITSITINGSPVDPAWVYRVGTFSFLGDGGDNFHVFRQGTNKRDSGLIDRDAWIAYIQASSPLSPSFARRAVQTTTIPATAEPGTQLQFTVSNLDLTSLGSPQNTLLDVLVGGIVIATVPVTSGSVFVDLTVPPLPGAARNVMLIARPSGTTVLPKTLVSVPPQRLLDTRGPTESPNALRNVPVQKIGGANVLQVKATDLGQLVPAAGVDALSLNVAVTNAEGNGFITAYACGSARPLAASVNYVTGETVSNSVIAPVGTDGNICFFSLAAVDLVVDVNGWMPIGGGFTPVGPLRVLDTRANESPNALRTVAKQQISGDPALEVQLTNLGQGGTLVPGAGVGAVALNVAVANSTRAGYLAVYPCGQRQLVANLNFGAGEVASNSVVVPVSATGMLCFYSPVPVDVIVDLNGWFAASSAFRGITPSRVADTRANESPGALLTVPKAKVGTTPLELKVTGLPGGLTPNTGVSAVSLNVAATNPDATGYITVYPCATVRQITANVNYIEDQTVSNGVITPVSANGTVCIFSLVPTDVVVDINGYFTT